MSALKEMLNLVAASTQYGRVAGEYHRVRRECSDYERKVDTYVQQLDQLRVEVDRLERQAHEQERLHANASQVDGQRSHEIDRLTHEVEVLMAKQRDADQRVADQSHDMQQLSDSVENYARKLVKTEAILAQVRDERDAEVKYAEEETQKSRAYRDRMVDLENKLTNAMARYSAEGPGQTNIVAGGISTETAYEKVDWTNPYQAGTGKSIVAPSAASSFLDRKSVV